MSTEASERDDLRRSSNSDNGGAADALPCTVLIEDRTFFRECVLASLSAMESDQEFQAFESVAAWEQSAAAARTSLLVLWMSAPSMPPEPDNVFASRLKQVLQLPEAPPVVVMSDHESADCVVYVMHSGASAFLPTSMGVEMAVKVLDLVRAGGSFIPASTLAAMTSAEEGAPRAAELSTLLSPRQLAVARAMRKGLPNKVIADELAMCESTVKVHVRTIMRKLNARNRTEVAFLTRDLDTDLRGGFAG
ncbi:response regulator transcription factor [Chelatococcus reniformis]|uniref:LuxR family transcriptional regulator n=1 Tax=Chelatococcus reniformis TaxID=1494448 RepID=A0A916UG92_9HYPH|nr:response regulator transcription factor [Chelatococcus reniformis]GGC72459.1 LuxR family transcriptional regulator [Chelatococcus reniformis]